jgi:hypothetical protein
MFANWTIGCILLSVFFISEIRAHILGYFFHGKSVHFDQNGLGYIFGEFLTNSSMQHTSVQTQQIKTIQKVTQSLELCKN